MTAPPSGPRIASIVFTPRGVDPRKPAGQYARVALTRATLVESQGIDGDAKGGPGDRQLNIMLAESLAELAAEGFTTQPGAMGEQIVIAGLDPSALGPSAQLKLGTAIVEIGIPRTGCARFEAVQGKPRQAARGRLGVMARVITGGVVVVGDSVEVIPPA